MPKIIKSAKGSFTSSSISVDSSGRVYTASSGAGAANMLLTEVLANDTTAGTFTAQPNANKIHLFLRGGGGGGGGGCFLKGTPITMADGSTKPVEQVDLGDEIAEGGKVFAAGRFLTEELHDYEGIKVSGSHMVNEDGSWVRVRDSEKGKPLGDDEHTVYVFGAENRRILINGILFTDYFEVKEQDKLATIGDKYFEEWKDHDKILVNLEEQNNVAVLNAN